jgi:hypothetical protein
MTESEYLTYPAAAEFLRARGLPIAVTTLRRYVSQRRLTYHKANRRVVFRASDLLAWLEAGRVQPVARGTR